MKPMNVLLVNSFLNRRGGDTTYLYHVHDMLMAHGHTPHLFGMYDPTIPVPVDGDSLLESIDFSSLMSSRTLRSAQKVMSRAIYSFEAKIKLDQFVKNKSFHIAHLNNIHNHLSPSILHTLRKNRIPVVWTLHDYTLLCPNSTFLSHEKICEKCKGGHFISCMLNTCKKDSLGASSIASFSAYVHRMLRLNRLVDYYIAPSNFLRKKFIEHGFDSSKIVAIPNPLPLEKYTPCYQDDGYLLFFGRLSPEKGVKTLIRAMARLPRIRLIIAGDGIQRSELESMSSLNRISHIDFVGHLEGEVLLDAIRRARFVVVPSQWYENYPYSVLESFALGKTVVGSNVGGIPELLDEGKTGVLFNMGDDLQLSEKIEMLYDDPVKCREMGKNARQRVERLCNPNRYYEELERIYTQIGQNGQTLT